MIGILCHQGVHLNPGLLWGGEAIKVHAPREGLWRTIRGGVTMGWASIGLCLGGPGAMGARGRRNGLEAGTGEAWGID